MDDTLTTDWEGCSRHLMKMYDKFNLLNNTKLGRVERLYSLFLLFLPRNESWSQLDVLKAHRTKLGGLKAGLCKLIYRNQNRKISRLLVFFVALSDSDKLYLMKVERALSSVAVYSDFLRWKDMRERQEDAMEPELYRAVMAGCEDIGKKTLKVR